MSRHKALPGLVAESYYYEDEDDYEDEYGAMPSKKQQKAATTAAADYEDDEDFDGEETAPQQKKKKAKPKKDTYQPDQKEVQALVDQFQGYFTIEQVKSTLVANKGDKPKTANDLKYKQDQLQKKNKDNIKQINQQKVDKQEQDKQAARKEQLEDQKLDHFFSKKIQKEEDELILDHKILNQIYPDVTYHVVPEDEAELAIHQNKLNLVIIGHVDSGKSTLMGHLLLKMGRVDQQEWHKVEKMSEINGKSSFKFAYLLDQETEERQRGVTIDVGQNYFETKKRQFVILDAPGHQDFVPNMIMGASQADVAILVIDGNTSEFERGFDGGGTKEHAILARSLGVTQIIVAVNKLDLVQWSAERYHFITLQVQPFLKSIGFRGENISFVPISGLEGTNLSERPTDVPLLTKWYTDNCLIETLDSLKAPKRSSNKPLRVCVYDYYKQNEGSIIGDCIQAKVDSGIVKDKDILLLMPLNHPVQVKTIEISKKRVVFAGPGDICEISLIIPPAVDPSYIKPGNVLCDPKYPINQVMEFRAQIVVFDIKIPITRGQPIMMFSLSSKIPGRIYKLEAIVNPKSGETIKANPKCLTQNQNAIVHIKLNDRACLELFSNYKQLGRITLRDGVQTLAAGIITELGPPSKLPIQQTSTAGASVATPLKKESSSSSAKK